MVDVSNPDSTFMVSPNPASVSQPSTFTANASNASYSWTFQSGNPAVSSAQTQQVVWNSAGTYLVSLTVTDADGCTASSSTMLSVLTCLPAQNQQQTFNYTGSPQTFTVPAGVCSLYIECWGAQGWTGNFQGGLGGYSSGSLAVTSGQQLYVYVGGAGQVAIGNMNPQGGGWNGGGHGQNNGTGNNVGGGGGASDVRTVFNANPMDMTSLQSRIIVAGGGGGSTNNPGCFGGEGGGATGGTGGGSPPGTGGTQNAGGSADGTFGQGGSGGPGMTPWNGGGGGGWYGGGVSTAHRGGGGGSGYIGGVTNGSMQSGVRSGNGLVVIHW